MYNAFQIILFILFLVDIIAWFGVVIGTIVRCVKIYDKKEGNWQRDIVLSIVIAVGISVLLYILLFILLMALMFNGIFSFAISVV